MTQFKVKLLYGTSSIKALGAEIAKSMLETLEKHNVKDLDTAWLYKDSEKTLGEIGAPKKFTMHTKAPGFELGIMSKKSINEGIEKSLKELGVSSVETYFLHAPDPKTSIEETLSAISELHAAGKFEHFGLSNFLVEDVQKIYDIQKSAGKVLPTVYQGNYSAVSRHIEEDLFPLLRKLGIAFYAYSPIAGGFLVKDPAMFKTGTGEGRWKESDDMYGSMYNKPSLLKGLEEWSSIAKEAGISKAALAYRWIAYNSALKPQYGDGVIIGASKVSQLEETLVVIEDGPLDEKTCKKIDAIWTTVKDDAPLDNYNSYAKLSENE